MTPEELAAEWLNLPTAFNYQRFWSSLVNSDREILMPSGLRTADRLRAMSEWTSYFVERARQAQMPAPKSEPSKGWQNLQRGMPLGPCWLWQESHEAPPIAALVCLREKGSTEQVVRTVEGHAISVPRFNYWIHPWQEEMPASPELEPALGEWSSRPWRGGLHRAVDARGVAFDVFVMERPGRPWTEWAKNTIVLNDLGGLTPLENEIVRWCRYVVPVSP